MLFTEQNHTLLEGSVVWLYCQANPRPSTLVLSWNKDGKPLVQDVPHIRLRRTGPNFILVVDEFQIMDSGAYQCIAQNGNDITKGRVASLIGIYFYKLSQHFTTHASSLHMWSR